MIYNFPSDNNTWDRMEKNINQVVDNMGNCSQDHLYRC